MSFYKHETSIVDENAIVGDHTKIWQFCNIMKGTVIGSDCNIGQNVFIESGVKVGNNVTIKNNISLYDGFECEDDVFLGPNCVFTNVITPRSFVSRKDEFKKTIVRRGASIGANATVICGNEIGRYAMIGAGAVVTKTVGDYELVVGNPAKKIGYVCRCGEVLVNQNINSFRVQKINCTRCGKSYLIENESIIEK